MKIIRQVDWKFTLYEESDGTYVLEIVVPATNRAWVNYEKKITLPSYEKMFIKMFPNRANYLADRLIDVEKKK